MATQAIQQEHSRTLGEVLYKGQRAKDRNLKILVYILLVIGGSMVMLPFFWMISTSLKKPGPEFTFPIEWIPRPPYWKNYIRGWTVLPFTDWAFNTLQITFFATLGSVISSAIVGFGFARIKFPGRDFFFMLVLATMMLPYPSVIVSLFILYKQLGWINTFLPLMVPNFFAVTAFYVFVLRQFFLTLPTELDDAARVDGCSTFGIFRHIAMPSVRPALGIIVVFSFMHNWNDFLGPLIYLSSNDNFTLALGLRFFQARARVQWTELMAVALIVLAPCVALFFIAQKYYIQGIVITGLKG